MAVSCLLYELSQNLQPPSSWSQMGCPVVLNWSQTTPLELLPAQSSLSLELRSRPQISLLLLHEGRVASLLLPHKDQSSALIHGLLGTQSHFQLCFCGKIPSELQAIHLFFHLFINLVRMPLGARPCNVTWGVRGLRGSPHLTGSRQLRWRMRRWVPKTEEGPGRVLGAGFISVGRRWCRRMIQGYNGPRWREEGLITLCG